MVVPSASKTPKFTGGGIHFDAYVMRSSRPSSVRVLSCDDQEGEEEEEEEEEEGAAE